MQTCIGPSEEHVSMAGIPTEASILDMVERAMPGRVQNVYAHSSGGGKFIAVTSSKRPFPVTRVVRVRLRCLLSLLSRN